MPGRRQRSLEPGDESDDASSATDSDQSAVSKRRRLVVNAASAHKGDADIDRTHTRHSRGANGPRRNSSPTTAGHQPGAIVRVKCRNFVTYTSATFRCGPSLNMIIGPNGTGKSTLVCAICLGLGFPPSCLGRAKEVGDFVTHGEREAEIEVELAGARDASSVVVKRIIKREGNKSVWSINGAPANLKKVLELMATFHIQIDNLCQFLPQDRVVEFAAQSPVELLESTQRAAAPDHVAESHKKLIKLGERRSALMNEQTTSKENLKQFEARQDAQRAEVDRINQRVDLINRVKALEKARVGLEYTLKHKAQTAADARKKQAEAEMKELKSEVAPAMQMLQESETYTASVGQVVNTRKALLDRTNKTTEKAKAELGALGSKLQDADTEYSAEVSANKKRRDTINQCDQVIKKLNTQLQAGPPDFDVKSYQQRAREKEQERNVVARQGAELRESMQVINTQTREIERSIAAKESELENLATQAGKKLSKLKAVPKIGDAAHLAWEWIRNNQDCFQDKVYGPPLVECTVKDQRFVDALEAICQPSDLCILTVTSQADYVKLQRILYTREGTALHDSPRDGITGMDGLHGLGLDKVSIRKVDKPLGHFQSPVTAEELARYDLDGWALNYLEGPEPVLAMLCDNGPQLHRTAISLRPHNAGQFAMIKGSSIASWIAGREFNRIVRRREYGPLAETANVVAVRPARFWESGDTGISTAETDLKKSIAELQSNLDEIQAQFGAEMKRFTELGVEQRSLASQKKEIDEEKKRLQKATLEYEGLSTKIESEREKMAGCKLEVEGSEQRRLDIRARLEGIALKRGKKAVDYSLDVNRLRQLHRTLLEAEVRFIEADSEWSSVKEHNAEVEHKLQERKRQIEEFAQQYRMLRDEAKRKKVQFEKIRAEATDQEWEVVEEWSQPDKNIDDLDAAIEGDTQRINLLTEGNPHTIRKYHERQKEIDRLKERVANFEGELDGLDGQIHDIRSIWEPELDRLIQQISEAFSHNFAQIGCAGQVGVHKDDDFSQWAIRIEVKFRENEQLSLLDSHRQSGGERAVSTIFYLMALQTLARAPFRVVDEINQGMDPRNERMVHERMVEIACRENTSQYFLITPKLLKDLKYDPRMSVHTIYSGETMPEDSATHLDLETLADRALTLA